MLRPEERRAAKIRWNALGKARVSHQTRGSLIVPSASNFAAILCAAEIWQCDWLEILEARVELCDQSLPIAEPPDTIFI